MTREPVAPPTKSPRSVGHGYGVTILGAAMLLSLLAITFCSAMK